MKYVKLQHTDSNNVHSISLPAKHIRKLGWEKGDVLIIELGEQQSNDGKKSFPCLSVREIGEYDGSW